MIYATVAGNLGRDAERKTLDNGDIVVSFSVASSRKAKGEEVTTWVRCSMWGKRADAVHRFLTKGTSVTVVGDMSVREYEKDGRQGYSIECRVADLKLQGGGPKTGDAAPKPAQQKLAPPPADDYSGFAGDDDIPF